MATRAVASGTVSFGLVSIPVKLYSATNPSSTVSFNLLHKKCNSRLKQQYICPVDNEIVPRDEMVKGYEFSKDQYVTFSKEELEALEEKSTQMIEITEFLPIEQVDPVYYEKAYYLGPEKGGEKSYVLLAKAMEETGRCAIAQYAARGKQYLVLLRPVGERLVMQQLRYADEVREIKEVPVADATVRDAEMKLAIQLIEQIAHETFNPGQYEDNVKNRIEELVRKKVEGQEVSVAAPEAPKAQIIDLMEALKASLAKKGVVPVEETAGEGAAASGSAEDRRPAKRTGAKTTSAKKKTAEE